MREISHEPVPVEKVISSKSVPFPEDLEGRLAAVLSLFTIETKTVVLASCLDDDPRTGTDIMRMFEYIVQDDVWVPNIGVFGAYAHYDFFPAGAVVEERVVFERGHYRPRSGSLAWRITEAGKRYVKPTAAFTLKYVVDNRLSMHPIIGSMQTAGSERAPYNRALILEKLVKQGRQRIADVGGNISRFNLSALERAGFASYDSFGGGSGWARYRWIKGKSPEDVGAYRTEKRLTKRVAAIFAESGSFIDWNEVLSSIKRNKGSVSQVVGYLNRNGFIEAERWTRESKSEIDILEPGKRFVREYLSKLRDALTDGNSLREMEEILYEFERNSALLERYASEAMRLYEKVSEQRHRRKSIDTIREMCTFIGNYHDPRGPKSGEIIASFGESARKYLRRLIDDGMLVKEKEGKEVRYRLVD